MGIQVEFNPDLALRSFEESKNQRKEEECLPEVLEVGKKYPFLKRGQRNYYFLRDELVPLLETQGNQQLSRPVAAIRMLEATHFFYEEEVWTKGWYEVVEVYDKNDETIHFEGFSHINS